MTPIIQIHNATKRYHNGHVALHELSLDVQKGDIYGIIGQSGAGKSTLIRLLAGLIAPTSGQVLFHGVDIARMDKKTRRTFYQKIGMIFQHFNLLGSRTVEANIAFPLEIAHMPIEKQKERVDELLKLVGLEAKRTAYPSQLSGGEKQRVGIARALACNPELLLCDEATSALDPKTTREILMLLNQINRKLGISIVLITHEMDVIKQICHKVAVIDKGHIVENGPVSDIFAIPEHPTTKHFLESGIHEIPDEFFENPSPGRRLLRLKFKGKAAREPLISVMVRRFDVDANILLGWIDRLQESTIGTLVIELKGEPDNISAALEYLTAENVHYELITHDTR